MIIYIASSVAYGGIRELHKAYYDKEQAQLWCDKMNKEDQYEWYEVEEVELEE